MSTPPESPTPGDQLAEKTKAAYRWWDNLATINAEDPLWLGAIKIGFRLLGILVLIAISPLILLGFFFVFLAVA